MNFLMKLVTMKILIPDIKLMGFILAGVLAFSNLIAQDLPEKPDGHVNDYVNLLSTTEQNRLEQKLRAYRDTTTNVITVAILNELSGYSKEEAATKLFNDWKMWHEDRYNGILILIVPAERKIKIETGYGLEGAFPDVVANTIIDRILTPYFRNNQFYKGLDEATTAISNIIAGEFTGNLESANLPTGQTDYFEILKVLAFFGFIIFILWGTKGRGGGGRRRHYHSLGAGGIIIGHGGFGSSRGGFSSGGGFGGFSGGGGFGSGGGGAGGSW